LSVSQWSAHGSLESWVGGVGRVEQPLVLVVGFVGVEQAGAVPGLDRAGVHAEPCGRLGDREQPSGAESLVVAGEAVGATDVQHDVGGERLAGSGQAPGVVELLGGLTIGVIVEELVE
jgi:hypothetical protein